MFFHVLAIQGQAGNNEDINVKARLTTEHNIVSTTPACWSAVVNG
jgi:hypothetical protein